MNPDSDSPSEGSAPSSGSSRDVLWMFGFGALWLGLAAVRPDTTYHLAPVVVVACRPFFRWSTARPELRAVIGDVLGGAALAVTISLVLNGAGWDRGGVLFGGAAIVESMILIGVTFVVLVAVGVLLARRGRPVG